MPMPKIGDNAPAFVLKSDDGETIRLADCKGKRVVLYFYPRADTPGCTKEACEFRDAYRAYEDKGVLILGVSPDTENSQSKFKAKYALPFPLLADTDHKVCEAYGVWGLKKFMGKEHMGVLRTTFIIDEKGKISHVFEGVKPEGHSGEVLAAL